MIYLHLLMAVLASWRITELFTQDRITQKLREKWPTYIWQCPRCMSVWSGAWCALMFALGPSTHITVRGFHVEWLSSWLGLWPFALAWLYLTHIESVTVRRMVKEGRRLIVEARGADWALNRNDFNLQETREILSNVLMQLVQSQQPPAPAAPAQPSEPLVPEATAAEQAVNGAAKK